MFIAPSESFDLILCGLDSTTFEYTDSVPKTISKYRQLRKNRKLENLSKVQLALSATVVFHYYYYCNNKRSRFMSAHTVPLVKK